MKKSLGLSTRQLLYAILFGFFLLQSGLFSNLFRAQAWSEESLDFYEPLSAPRTYYTSTTVSSIHFDLVGALAIAAGFSVTDTAKIQVYSQIVDSGIITGSTVYSLTAKSYPTPPPITSVMTSTFCQSPSTTAPTVTMGLTKGLECPGCFTSRWGPYGVLFHEPRERPNELFAMRDWALGDVPDLIGVVTFGYSGTASFDWRGIANIYDDVPCFVTQTVTIDTGDIAAGSLESLGMYLHSLGDYWSHKDCIDAAESLGMPFPAHVTAGPGDPLAPCRWTSHELEFGPPKFFPDSNRTFTGTLKVYEALTEYAKRSTRPIYRPIPVNAEGNHIYDTMYDLVHTSTFENPAPRRSIADELREWSLQTRSTNPAYWIYRAHIPIVLKDSSSN